MLLSLFTLCLVQGIWEEKERDDLFIYYYVPLFGFKNDMRFDWKGKGNGRYAPLQNFYCIFRPVFK